MDVLVLGELEIAVLLSPGCRRTRRRGSATRHRDGGHGHDEHRQRYGTEQTQTHVSPYAARLWRASATRASAIARNGGTPQAQRSWRAFKWSAGSNTAR